AHLNWIICGGSGFSLRRQRPEGPELTEVFPATEKSEMSQTRLVAKSQLFVGLTGHKTERRRPYSFLRIDVQAGRPPKFVIRPFISERYHQLWNDYALDPLVI
ncbi:MAG: metallophosphoesterase, partial [Pseudanabaenales cyanobacterium]|nr:metallophosphoesterase [Pseudanabaenales cyanobacterium]